MRICNYKPRICVICSKEFKPTNPTQKYCSEECYKIGQRQIAITKGKMTGKGLDIRTCEYCGKLFKPTGYKQKYCKECSIIVKRETSVRWQKEHPERVKLSRKKNYNKYPDKAKQATKQWLLKHPEWKREEDKEQYRKHLQKIKERQKRYLQTHLDKWRKYNAKRERNLDFIPLNEPFENAEAHHLDKIYVIYIPKEVHRSIWHSVIKNINMDEINAIAFNYL